MTIMDDVTWWTAFGAIAQAIGALATFAAVAVSLWIVLSERTMKASGQAGIWISFMGDGTPGIYMVAIRVLNVGIRAFEVNSVGWRTGWMARGPEALTYRHAIQNTGLMIGQQHGARIVEPGRDTGYYTPIADMKINGDEARRDLFVRRLPFLGEAPIWAVAHITGRKPLYIKVSGELAAFLRTNEHASTTADNA